MKIKIAFGLENDSFPESHFGDSKYFDIYEMNKGEMTFIERRNNIKFDEDEHGAAKKAGHISNQLKDMDVFVAKVFGPNIKMIRRNFVPVIVKNKTFRDTLSLLPSMEKEITTSIEKNILHIT